MKRRGSHEMSQGGHMAGANFEKAEKATVVRRFGMGAGELKPEKKGPGVRSDQYQHGHERFTHKKMDLTKRDQERLDEYRKLLEDVERGLSSEDQIARFRDIREKFEQELREGGFLTPERISQLSQYVRDEERAAWSEEARTLWDETVAALSQIEDDTLKD